MGNHYRADIDGLRAVAIILVVAFHAAPGALPGGFIGVDVFFVISGYLITGLILDQQVSGSFSIREFYIRRARRILPALAVVIAATLAIGWFVLLPLQYEKLGLHAISAAWFFPNLIYWSEEGYFDVAAKVKPLLHLWSLGVEEQFYLVWPLLLVVLHRRKAQLTTVLCALGGLSLLYSSIVAFRDPAAAFYSPLSRLWELGVGGILASKRLSIICYRDIVSSLGLILVLGAALKLTNVSPLPGVLALIPVSGTALVIAAGSHILSWRPLVALGLISYPLYLWHWPLLSFAAIHDLETRSARATIIALSILLAWATTRYIEYPIRFGYLRTRGAAISIAAVLSVALGSALIFHSGGLPLRYPEDIRPVLSIMKYQFHGPARYRRCWLTKDASFDDYGTECRNGKIAIWGDSFSALLGTGFPRPYAQFNRDGCPPLLDVGYELCAKSNAAVLYELLQIKPQRIILFTAWPLQQDKWQPDGEFTRSLRYTLSILKSGVEDIILIGPSPEWLPSLPAAVFKFWSKFGTLPDRLKVSAEMFRATDGVMNDIAKGQHVRFISVFDALCNVEDCLTHTPNSRAELLFFDYGHMTIEGANYIVREMGLAEIDREYTP